MQIATVPMVRRVALITGVGRTTGIGAAVARLSATSHDLMLTGLPTYDAEQATASEELDTDRLVAELSKHGARVEYAAAELAQPDAPQRIVAEALERFGGVDTLVVAHAHAKPASLAVLSAGEIDRHLDVNVRATLLLVKAFAAAHERERGQGRVVLFSSGQRLGPMPAELPYVASKGALEALVLSLAEALAPLDITVNAINPGPTDTGLLSGPPYDSVRARFPAGRWGTPGDAARAVAWLTGENAAWITGQVLDSEGGFRRWHDASTGASAPDSPRD